VEEEKEDNEEENEEGEDQRSVECLLRIISPAKPRGSGGERLSRRITHALRLAAEAVRHVPQHPSNVCVEVSAG
jgi:hypothetical protein